jgi:hypothetical protein
MARQSGGSGNSVGYATKGTERFESSFSVGASIPSKSPVPNPPGCPPHRAGLASGKQIMTKPTEEQIRQRAQEIWEENHRPAGRDDEFWYQAERQLEAEEQLKDMPEDF